MKYRFICLFFLLMCSQSSLAQSPGSFYVDYIEQATAKNLVTDYGANGMDQLSDSEALQRAIDELSQLPGGGKINIPAGTYYLSEISLKSNIHLKMAEGVKIIVEPVDHQKNYALFYLGRKADGHVENVSFRGIGATQFEVDLRQVNNPNVRVFQCNHVTNFMIRDVFVWDNYTKFNAITLGVNDYNADDRFPHNGMIKNSHIEHAHYGYGLVQSQASRNLYYKDISGVGGVTLRLETGSDLMNRHQIGGNFDVYADGVKVHDGNSALMISPHGMINGHVDAKNIESVNSGFAVRVGKGFVNKGNADDGISPGYYASTSIIKNVKATYGTSATVKSKHFKYIPCALRGLIGGTAPGGEGSRAPAVVAVLNTARGNQEGNYNVNISGIESIGFDYSPDVKYEEDAVSDCSKLPNPVGFEVIEKTPDSFQFAWRINETDVPVDHYEVIVNNQSSITEEKNFNVNNAEPNTDYFITITAVDAHGNKSDALIETYQIPAVMYQLTVLGGLGSGYYEMGEIVQIEAEHYFDSIFNKWEVATNLEIEEQEAESTKIKMPGNNLKVKAVFIYTRPNGKQKEFDSIPFYPNPSRGEITFNYPIGTLVEIYNEKGKIYWSSPLMSPQLNLDFLPSGKYLMRIKGTSYSLIHLP